MRSAYSYDDTSGDTSFSDFNINKAPSYVFSVIKDIMSLNSLLKVHIVPWSPVRFRRVMSTTDWYVAARLDEDYGDYGRWLSFVSIRQHLYVLHLYYPFQIDEPQILDANYLLKCVQGFNNEGIFPYAISIQVGILTPIKMTSLT